MQISDINAELINTYNIIKNRIDELIKLLESYQAEYLALDSDERRNYYMDKREKFNDIKVNGNETKNLTKAAMMMFLIKKHILSSVGKKAKLLLNKETFYDFKKQLSFMDINRKILVLNASKEGTIVETSTIENSDPDEFAQLPPKTSLTETIENSDVDEFAFNFSGTKETRAIEDSDIDSIVALSSKITKSLEDSDVDSFVAPPTTKSTYTE